MPRDTAPLPAIPSSAIPWPEVAVRVAEQHHSPAVMPLACCEFSSSEALSDLGFRQVGSGPCRDEHARDGEPISSREVSRAFGGLSRLHGAECFPAHCRA